MSDEVYAGGLRLAFARRDPAILLAGLAQKGDGLARLPLGPRALLGRNFWVVSSPHLLKQVLVTNASNYDKDGPLFGVIRRALGDEGWFTVNDEVLLGILRERMLPAFQRSNLAPAVGMIGRLMSARVSSWSADRPVELFDEMRQVSIEFLVRYMLGAEANVAKIARLTSEVFAGMAGGLFLSLWLPGSKKYARAISGLMAEIEAIITFRRASGVRRPDLLGCLLDIEPRLTDKQVRDQVVTILMAGQDSTAASLAWGFIRLSQRFDLFSQLQAEVLTKLGTKVPTLADLRDLHELQCFVRAVFHDRPAFPLYPRNAVEADILGGKLIRPGDQIVVSPYAAHHNPRVWGSFDYFWRQWAGGLEKEQRLAHLPFGLGKRKCPGEDLATYFALTVLAIFLQNVASLRRIDGHTGERVHFAMTAFPADLAAMELRMR